MKQLFLAYRASGKDKLVLERQLSLIKSAVESCGHEVYITDFDKDITDHSLKRAYQKICDSDGLLVFMDDDIKSEGMLVEIGFAYKKVPIYLCKREGLSNRFDDLVDDLAFWSDESLTVGAITELIG